MIQPARELKELTDSYWQPTIHNQPFYEEIASLIQEAKKVGDYEVTVFSKISTQLRVHLMGLGYQVTSVGAMSMGQTYISWHGIV